MKMPTSAELGGIHPRSEQLIELTRSYDRGKTERASVEKQIELDTIELVKLQDESGFENFTDGAFSWQDQFRPVVESLDGITTGTRHSTWFHNNTLYKKPTVEGIDARFTVQTYFGDATTILPYLLKLPVDGIGFDLFETDHTRSKIETKKTLALGIVDSRESNIEDPRWIAETATRVSKHIF